MLDWLNELKLYKLESQNQTKISLIYLLYSALIIYLITTAKPNGQRVTSVPKDKALYTLTKYDMNHLYKYLDFP